MAHRWTPGEMPDQTGRTALVTGANSGIGFHTALELARHGAAVALGCRDVGKGEAAATRIRDEVPSADVRVARLDLGSLDAVQELAEGWQGPLDLLVNNAGLMAPPRFRQTSDGFELQFGTNHLGHFALTGRLLPHLLRAPAARVVAVSSVGHRMGGRDVVDGNPVERYNPQHSYGNSKLANLLFAFELQRRAARAGVSLTATAAHPGVSSTNLVASEQGLGSVPGVKLLAPLFMNVLFQPARAGAVATLYAATVADPGSYTGPGRFGESRGAIGPASLSETARDEALAAELWEVSEKLTEVTYDWETVPS